MKDVYELIKQRKSVRTFDGDEITPSQREDILRYAGGIKTPYDIGVEVRILDGGLHGLSSPVIVGCDTYIAGKMQRAPHAEETFGFFFEELVLYMQSMGLGTTWIAGTMNRKVFEDAMELSDGEVMPCVSPLGKAAEKRSVRETMMRTGVRADNRKEFGELFFFGRAGVPLARERYPELTKVLEAVRWAPSAVNKQPWRVIVTEHGAHFYIKHDKGYRDSSGWDIQKIDIGIALCHFSLCAENDGMNVAFAINDPGLEANGMEYMASFIF